jgi:hypothetical protein
MQGGPGGRQFDPERMRQMMEQRLREMLGATEQEWVVLGPRVMKVQELSRQVGGRGMMGGPGGMMGGPRGMMGGPGGMQGGRRGQQGGPGGNQPGGRFGAQDRELSAVEKAQQELQTLLQNTEATPESIKQGLTRLRSAKETAKQNLAKAQQELRKVLTVRQEALCVLMAMLD